MAVEVDPIREAQREWEKAARYLHYCLSVYRKDRGCDELLNVSRAVDLAAAYDEERTLHDTYEALLIDEMAAEIRRG